MVANGIPKRPRYRNAGGPIWFSFKLGTGASRLLGGALRFGKGFSGFSERGVRMKRRLGILEVVFAESFLELVGRGHGDGAGKSLRSTLQKKALNPGGDDRKVFEVARRATSPRRAADEWTTQGRLPHGEHFSNLERTLRVK